MRALAPPRLVKSRYLRAADGSQFAIVVDYTPRESAAFRVATVWLERPDIVEDVEHCAELDSACFVLGARVRRALRDAALWRRREEAA